MDSPVPPHSPSVILSPREGSISRAASQTPLSTPGRLEPPVAVATPEQDVPTPTTSPRRTPRSRSGTRTPPPQRTHRRRDSEMRRTPPRSSPGRLPPPKVVGGPPRPLMDMSVPPPGHLLPAPMPIAGLCWRKFLPKQSMNVIFSDAYLYELFTNPGSGNSPYGSKSGSKKKILISIFFSKFNYKNNSKIYLYFYGT